MIGCLGTCGRKQPIIALYFEFENELKFYNLEAWFKSDCASTQSYQSLKFLPEGILDPWLNIECPLKTLISLPGCPG